MKNSKEQQRITKQIETLRVQQDKLQREEFEKKVLPSLRAKIGTTYVYRDNRYSSDGKWDTFRKLTDIRDGGYSHTTVFVTCQIDCDGRASIEHDHGYLGAGNTALNHGGWAECSPNEYEAMLTKCLRALHLKRRSHERTDE